MKEPVHEFKSFARYAGNYKPPRWSFDGRPCWLGSGIKDKNGREIFEGDRVKVNTSAGNGRIATVAFHDCAFWLMVTGNNREADIGALPVAPHLIEVVGHVSD